MMTRVTTMSLPSLGAALGCILVLSGCKLFKSSEKTAEDPFLLPPPVAVQPIESKPETPSVEEPYMLPPLVEGYQEGDPILPDVAEKPEKPAVKLQAAPPEPVDPTLELPPDHVDPLTQANTVTKSFDDGLYYKAGDSEPYTGNAVFIHENGQRAFEGFFKNGQRHGKCLGWYENGKVKFEGLFQNDKLHEGHEYWYYTDGGTLKLIGVYENGQMVRGHHWNRQGRAFR